MKCYNHLKFDAVATCQDCGVGLCKSCYDRYGTSLCDTCNLARAKLQRKQAFVELMRLAVVFVLASIGIAYLFNTYFVVGGESLIADGVIGAVLGLGAVCLVAGWKMLSGLSMRSFGVLIIFPVIGWVLYGLAFCVKVGLSLIIGVIAAPYSIIKNILTIAKMNRIERLLLNR